MVKRFAAGTTNRKPYKTEDSNYGNLMPTFIPASLSNNRRLITTTKQSTLGEAVKIMNKNGVSSIIIKDENEYPIGIITDRDIRHIVATKHEENMPVVEVMNFPVKTIPSNMILQEVQLTMIECGLHHLCITEDGTPMSKGIGMVTEHDILYANASDPIVILKKIKYAYDVITLKECRNKIDALLPNFLNDNLNRRITLSLIDRLNSALISRTVDVTLEAYNRENEPIPQESFCFYTMGSGARGEQLLMTDQDTGIIINDEYSSRKEDFLTFAQMISDALHMIGYEYCPANMMASNPDWCKTLSEMKQLVNHWIQSPGPEEVLMTAIFFDFRFEFGNIELYNDLKSTILKLKKDQDVYIRFLVKSATSTPPPLSFFRKFIIEKNGEYKDMFDIKLRGISPLSDCARVLALDEGFMTTSNTYERYQALKQADPANAILYDDAAEAYLDLLSFRLQFALKNEDSGRYINIEQLDKLHRIYLRRTFVPTRQLIQMIERKYKLGYL